MAFMDYFSDFSMPSFGMDDLVKGLGLLQTGMGVGGGIYNFLAGQDQANQLDKALRQQNARANEVATLARSPIDWQQFYTPLTEAETAAMRRAMEADYATRGVPRDSQLVTSEIARMLGETQGQRVANAQQMGQTFRGQQLQGLGAYGMPRMPQFPQLPPAPDISGFPYWWQARQQPNPPPRPIRTQLPGMASMAGDTSSAMWDAWMGTNEPGDRGAFAYGPSAEDYRTF